jgi:epoxyqueuosine reductase
MSPDLAPWLRAEALALGFSRVRFAPLDRQGPGIEHYDRFLAEGRHADMDWMVRGRDPRARPHTLLDSARSVVVLGTQYGGARPPDPGGLTGKVARYAWGRDYHNLVGKRVRKLVRAIGQRGHGAYGGVDSRPLLERAWAEAAGVAFLGKNCCAIVPGEGSWLFLAAILVDADLPPDVARPGLERHCGPCTRCLGACPTDAFVASAQLDARRCISYWTIEAAGAIPVDLRSSFGRWVFGCDDCQDVCPHNARDAEIEERLRPLPGRAWLDLAWVLDAAPEEIDRKLEGSPLRRPGPRGLKRNAAVVLGNIGDPNARPLLRRAADGGDPLIAEHARWALDRLG